MKPKAPRTVHAKARAKSAAADVQIKLLHQADLFDVEGYQAAAYYAGIKKRRRDVTLIVSDTPATAAGIYTKNAVVAAPIVVSKETTDHGVAQAIVCNSGCANACTGERGMADARRMQELTAEAIGCDPAHVLVASTGVIGQLLPMDKVEEGIREASHLLPLNEAGAAAEGIMTTDTVPKQIVVEATANGRTFRIGGIAKGAGMIAPNMATMLGFLVTDAGVRADILRRCLKATAERSFNAVSVDHDTSTNDCVFILANGASEYHVGKHIPVGAFQAALDHVAIHLAKAIARDGEGATKIIQATVSGARSAQDAKRASKAIIDSPLVKSAAHGADPNWGRILAAVGYSGAKVVLEKVNVRIGNPKQLFHVLSNGEPLQFDRSAANVALKSEEMRIHVDLGLGRAEATAYGCDLSREYVDINAHYTT